MATAPSTTATPRLTRPHPASGRAQSTADRTHTKGDRTSSTAELAEELTPMSQLSQILPIATTAASAVTTPRLAPTQAPVLQVRRLPPTSI
ncbi:hypothetical protein BJP40_02890 [Streptomyces sp. CC53]|nr:hypothetical protein BJP40_02890 [Streptomyces sp. CC53]